jgi:import inner membrane translocase subunit TIM17
MGAIGGGIWHGIKGARNSPRGERLIGSVSAIKARAPVLGGNFGVWGGLFSSFDCAVKGYRQKEDPWNAITAGFLTGGSLAFRGELNLHGREGVAVSWDIAVQRLERAFRHSTSEMR